MSTAAALHTSHAGGAGLRLTGWLVEAHSGSLSRVTEPDGGTTVAAEPSTVSDELR